MMRIATTACLLTLLLLAGCASTPAVSTSSAATSSSSAATSTTSSVISTASSTTASSTSATSASTVAGSSASLQLVNLCKAHCEKLKAYQELPPCTTYVVCAGQLTDASIEVTALINDMTAAGVSLNDYPKLKDALQQFIDSTQQWNKYNCTSMKPDGSDLAVNCGVGAFTAKLNASLVGVILEGLAR